MGLSEGCFDLGMTRQLRASEKRADDERDASERPAAESD